MSRPVSTAHLILGQRMQAIRAAAGITPEQAARVLRTSSTRISRMESGRAVLSMQKLECLLDLYGADDEEIRAIMKLASGQPSLEGWWLAYSDSLPSWVEPYFNMEAQAAAIYAWETQFVPGLLQTDGYMREVLTLGSAQGEALLRRAEARAMRRDILLRADPPRLVAVIDEAVFRRPAAGPEIMREQLRHLIKMCAHPAVSLRVLPLNASVGLTSTFTILRFDEPGPRDIVYIEHYTGAVYLDGQGDLDAYMLAMQDVLGKAAPEEETPRVLQGILDGL